MRVMFLPEPSKKDRQHLAQMMLKQVNGIYDDYLLVILLFIELGHAAQIDSERQYRNVDETPFHLSRT